MVRAFPVLHRVGLVARVAERDCLTALHAVDGQCDEGVARHAESLRLSRSIEQWKRERLAGKWRGHKHTSAKPIKPGTVNREPDTLRGIFSKAIEWGKLLEHPMRKVKRLKVDNRRTRILTEAEQLALLATCPKKLGRMVRLALITGARFGELLALTWDEVSDSQITFRETKNGKSRTLDISAGIKSVLAQCPKTDRGHVFLNPRTRKGYTVNGVAHVFGRALERAGITSADVTLHTLLTRPSAA